MRILALAALFIAFVFERADGASCTKQQCTQLCSCESMVERNYQLMLTAVLQEFDVCLDKMKQADPQLSVNTNQFKDCVKEEVGCQNCSLFVFMYGAAPKRQTLVRVPRSVAQQLMQAPPLYRTKLEECAIGGLRSKGLERLWSEFQDYVKDVSNCYRLQCGGDPNRVWSQCENKTVKNVNGPNVRQMT